MGKSGDKKNNQEFSHGDVVRLKSGSPELVVCGTPAGSNDAPDGWTWTVMWVEEEPGAASSSRSHPSYFAIPMVALAKQNLTGD